MEKDGKKAKGMDGRSAYKPGTKPSAHSSAPKPAESSLAVPPPEWPAGKSVSPPTVLTPFKKDAVLARNAAKRVSEPRGVVYSLTGSDGVLRQGRETGLIEGVVKSSSLPGTPSYSRLAFRQFARTVAKRPNTFRRRWIRASGFKHPNGIASKPPRKDEELWI